MTHKKSLVVTLTLIAVLSLSRFATAQHYQQTNLVSDVPGLAALTDPNLVNPWGIAHSGTAGPWWVNDNGTGVSELFDGAGHPFPIGHPLVVTVPTPSGTGTSAPTGIVFNGTTGFELTPGNRAIFIFVTEDGTISGWNPALNPANETLATLIKVDNSATAVYKGATLGQRDGGTFLYATNFKAGTMEVYDSTFTPVTLSASAFTDPDLPADFVPFNVQNIGGNIFVSFAKKEAGSNDEVHGPGLGFVDAFTPDGVLLLRLKHGRWMNAPWGMALAPANFGKSSNHLLVGMFGSGNIATFDPQTGNFSGLLRGPVGHPITIDGLWGLAFGNGGLAGPTNTLFFAAGINDEADGLFGTLTAINGDED